MWSTIVDAPITWSASREAAVKTWGAAAVDLADATDIASLLESNRAGPSETKATLDVLRASCQMPRN